MDKFLTDTLVTATQRNSDDYDDSPDEAGSLEDFMGSNDSFDFGDFSGASWDASSSSTDFDSMFDTPLTPTIEETPEKAIHEKENIWLSIICSPYYLFYYVLISIFQKGRLKTVDGMRRFLTSTRNVSIGVLCITLFLIFATTATFIFSLYTQTILAIATLGGSVVGLQLLKNPSVQRMLQLSDAETNADGKELLSDDDFDSLDTTSFGATDDFNFSTTTSNSTTKTDEFDFGDDFGEFDFNSQPSTNKNTEFDFGNSTLDSDGFDFGEEDDFEADFDFSDDFEFSDAQSLSPKDLPTYDESKFANTLVDKDIHESIDFADYDTTSKFESPTLDMSKFDVIPTTGSFIPPSPVDVTKFGAKDDPFYDQLKAVYEHNEKYRGYRSSSRKELVQSLSGYLISNDKKFGEWDVVSERSVVYDNIAYTLYLAFAEIAPSFKDKMNPRNRLIIYSVKENPLMYRIEVEVPKESFKGNLVTSKKSIFEEKMKDGDSDTAVGAMISKVRESFVIKLVKPVKGLISLGDVLRFHNDELGNGTKQIYDTFTSEKLALPLVLGLRDIEYPYAMDFGDNTSAVVAGESGSGKSWGTFLIMVNLVISNSFEDVNFVIMDRKKAVFWKEFSRLPHVVGYHTDVPDYDDILEELLEEMETRKRILDYAGHENWKSLRKDLKKSGNPDDLASFPWLIVILDEISNTLKELNSHEDPKQAKEDVDRFCAKLAMIAQEGRSLGMKLVLIGQRTIAASMPKDAMKNASFKFAFKLDEADFSRIIEGYSGSLPSVVGQAVVKDAETSSPQLLRTLSVGGIEDTQISNLFRILAFEWYRRSDGLPLVKPKTLNFTYNRPVQLEKLQKDLDAGKFFVTSENSTAGAVAEALRQGLDITQLTTEDIEKLQGQLRGSAAIPSEDSIPSSPQPLLKQNPITPTIQKPIEKPSLAQVPTEEMDFDFEENSLPMEDAFIDVQTPSIPKDSIEFDFPMADSSEPFDFDFDFDDDDDVDFGDALTDEDDSMEFDFGDGDFDFDESLPEDNLTQDSAPQDFDNQSTPPTRTASAFSYAADEFDSPTLSVIKKATYPQRDNSIPIASFIAQYGEKNNGGLVCMPIQELNHYYDYKSIRRCMMQLNITKNETHYLI